MGHRICRVTSCSVVAPHTVRVGFDDGTEQVIDLQPILHGDVYGPLRDLAEFDRVTIDPEVHTLVWPSGADFDPETLHDWPAHADRLRQRAREWASRAA